MASVHADILTVLSTSYLLYTTYLLGRMRSYRMDVSTVCTLGTIGARKVDMQPDRVSDSRE